MDDVTKKQLANIANEIKPSMTKAAEAAAKANDVIPQALLRRLGVTPENDYLVEAGSFFITQGAGRALVVDETRSVDDLMNTMRACADGPPASFPVKASIDFEVAEDEQHARLMNIGFHEILNAMVMTFPQETNDELRERALGLCEFMIRLCFSSGGLIEAVG